MSLDRDDVTAVVADSVGWVWLEESSIQNSTNWLPWISLMLCKMQQAVITLGTCWSSISFCFINRLHLAFRWLNPLLCMHVITDSWIFSLHLSSQNFEEKVSSASSPGSRKGRKRQRGGANRKRRWTRAWSLLFCGLYVSLCSHCHNDHLFVFIALLLLQWRHVRASTKWRSHLLACMPPCVQGQAVQLRCSCPAI